MGITLQRVDKSFAENETYMEQTVLGQNKSLFELLGLQRYRTETKMNAEQREFVQEIQNVKRLGDFYSLAIYKIEKKLAPNRDPQEKIVVLVGEQHDPLEGHSCQDVCQQGRCEYVYLGDLILLLIRLIEADILNCSLNVYIEEYLQKVGPDRKESHFKSLLAQLQDIEINSHTTIPLNISSGYLRSPLASLRVFGSSD